MEKVVSNIKTFAYKGCKIDAQNKNLFFCKFCLTGRIFFCIGATNCSSREMLCLPYAEFFFTNTSKLLSLLFQEPKGSHFIWSSNISERGIG